jgi:2-dehydro-3-deoxyphosphogluconate aldolase/(4S)-4-hydroxy-2-oxoglutarate aldolase
MSDVIEAILTARVIAVIRLEHYDEAIPLTQALVAGGISLLEFTLTGQGALAAIGAVRSALGETVHVGAGTVLSTQQATEALEAGATFVVTPVVQPEVIATCSRQGIVSMCGAFTPTEVFSAQNAGADFIKIFPARLGGPKYLADLLGPFPHLRLIPTGGVNAENAGAFLQAGAVAIGVGSNLVSPMLVARGDWAQITARAQSYVAATSARAAVKGGKHEA